MSTGLPVTWRDEWKKLMVFSSPSGRILAFGLDPAPLFLGNFILSVRCAQVAGGGPSAPVNKDDTSMLDLMYIFHSTTRCPGMPCVLCARCRVPTARRLAPLDEES